MNVFGSSRLRVRASAAVTLVLSPFVFGQAPALDPLELARYDTNKNGRLDPEEIAARDAGRRPTAPAAAAGGEPPREEPVLLSPFEVMSQDRGYYASSTMSGTRLNSRVEDLASSISVVTKEQMSDFAMLDINDIFLYEAGTEGIGTYTEFSVDRNGSPVDNSLNPNTANRVRGVGAANLSFANFELSGRMPIDPLLIDAVEISRGPNSTVFGLGNAAGTVNMQPATANLSRNRSRLDMRVDSYGGYRTSLDLNRILVKDTLALRGSAAFMHEGYERKPSGTNTKRLNGMVRYRPFRNTTLTASHFYYHITGNRPNTTTPRDAITGWINAGKPTWDPYVLAANAVKIDGIVRPGNYTATTLPTFFANANFRAQSTLFIDNDGSIGYWGPSRTTNTNTPNTPNENYVIVNSVPDQIRATQPLFASDPAVSSRAIYDWSEINLAAMNRLNETTHVTHLQAEQILLDTPRHMLAVQGAYFRETGKRDNRSLYGTAGSSGATGFLHVDVNERMLDGSPNPFFLRPFVGFFNTKGIVRNPYERETYRAQLAYRLDLRREQNALRWLGMQQVVGYGEFKDNRSRTDTFRDVILSNHSWYPQATGAAADFPRPEVALNYYRYYVGDNVGFNADQAPKDFAPGVYNYRWGSGGANGRFQTEQARLGSGYWYDSTNTWDRSLLKTKGGVLQSHLLGGRVVSTFGLRKDERSNRQRGTPLFVATPDGIVLDYASTHVLHPSDWVRAAGDTRTAGVVVKPTSWLNLHYNKSDSFQPAGVAVGLYLQPLPDPTGSGKDYGFSLNLFNGKVMLRANKYETVQIDTRNGSMRTIAQRVRNLDFDSPNGNAVFNLQTLSRRWEETRLGRPITDAEAAAAAARITGLDIAYYTRPETRGEQNELVAETQDVTAKGTEIELHFNPTSSWTNKINVTEQQSIDSKLAPGASQWIAERLPAWQRIIDPETGRPWFTERYNNSNSASQYLAANVTSQLNIATATQGKSRPQIRKYRVNYSTSYRLAGLTDNPWLKKFTVGGAVRWEDKGAIGYYGVQSLPAIITELDPARPVYDKARTYFDAFFTYRTKLSPGINASFQLNVRNIQENGRLQPISALPDGTANGYRIVDPRQFIFTASFDI